MDRFSTFERACERPVNLRAAFQFSARLNIAICPNIRLKFCSQRETCLTNKTIINISMWKQRQRQKSQRHSYFYNSNMQKEGDKCMERSARRTGIERLETISNCEAEFDAMDPCFPLLPKFIMNIIPTDKQTKRIQKIFFSLSFTYNILWFFTVVCCSSSFSRVSHSVWYIFNLINIVTAAKSIHSSVGSFLLSYH